jgi:hypothetical protein
MTQRWSYLALAVISVAAGCRRVPAQEYSGSGTMPSTDTTLSQVPEHYRFLRQPGVGMKDLDSAWARLPYDSIYLRREPCFGTCPMYDATLYRGGKARYHGTRFVPNLGDFRGEVTVQDYGRLSYLLDKLGFMSLPDSFSVPVTDLPGATMTASRRPQGVKSVHDYGYVGPVELWTVMQVFDGIVGRIQWEKTAP